MPPNQAKISSLTENSLKTGRPASRAFWLEGGSVRGAAEADMPYFHRLFLTIVAGVWLINVFFIF
jgi:hypothetical protein